MGVTAKLAIQLRANDVVVAESDDAGLWNRVFSAITKGDTEIGSLEESGSSGRKHGDGGGSDDGGKDGMTAFAKELNVSIDELIGACSPEDSAPYIQLEAKNWETLRRHTGERGANAIAPLALAVTLLALWAKHRGSTAMPKAADGQKVLNSIHLTDKNPSRSLTNCEWLQQRNGAWVINPAKRSHAIKLARAYVLGESPIEAAAK